MNWAGELSQKFISTHDTVLEVGCGIMPATLDTYPTYPKTRLKCASLLGLDVYRPYLLMLKTKNVETLQCDGGENLPFQDKTFDVVLMLDFLEHLPLNKINHAVVEAKRVAKKNVVILTPLLYIEQNINGPDSYVELGYEPSKYQRHLSVVPPILLEGHHFKVRIICDEGGTKYLFAVLNLTLWQKLQFEVKKND